MYLFINCEIQSETKKDNLLNKLLKKNKNNLVKI